jgi:hypothetical protein
VAVAAAPEPQVVAAAAAASSARAQRVAGFHARNRGIQRGALPQYFHNNFWRYPRFVSLPSAARASQGTTGKLIKLAVPGARHTRCVAF